MLLCYMRSRAGMVLWTYREHNKIGVGDMGAFHMAQSSLYVHGPHYLTLSRPCHVAKCGSGHHIVQPHAWDLAPVEHIRTTSAKAVPYQRSSCRDHTLRTSQGQQLSTSPHFPAASVPPSSCQP